MKKELILEVFKLKTIANYAKMKLISVTRVYQLEKEDKINVVKIDGVKFVKLV